MSDLHQLSYHTFTRSFDTQSGDIYLSAAKKAWRRRNELLVDPEPILLIDVAKWREERGNEAILWSESALCYQLSNHPSTQIRAPHIAWEGPLQHALQTSTSALQKTGEFTYDTTSATLRAVEFAAQLTLTTPAKLISKCALSGTRHLTNATIKGTKFAGRTAFRGSQSALHGVGSIASATTSLTSSAVTSTVSTATSTVHVVSHGTASAVNATLHGASQFISTSTHAVVSGITAVGDTTIGVTRLTLNLPLSLAKVSWKATTRSAAWTWGVGEATLELLGELVPTRSTLATLTRWASHLSLSFAVALMLLFAGPVVVLQTQDFLSQANFEIPHVQLPFQTQEAPLPPSPTPTPQPDITSAEDVFSISVPDLKIHSTITPNVDPGNEKEYSAALKKGIAHAAGSALPEQYDFTKTVYLFAHSTDAPWNIARYNAQFYALKDAKPGQEIVVRFWGKDYHYTIETTEIIDAKDVSHLQPQLDEERLVLQTCYPPGTTWKRLLVVAKPTQNGSAQTP